MTLERINPPALPPASGFSQVVRALGAVTIYISGQISMDAQGKVVGAGDLAVQAQKAFDNLTIAIAAGGATVEDVAMMRIYVVDYDAARDGAAIGAAIAASIGNASPATTLISVPALSMPELLVEVEAVAVVD